MSATGIVINGKDVTTNHLLIAGGAIAVGVGLVHLYRKFNESDEDQAILQATSIKNLEGKGMGASFQQSIKGALGMGNASAKDPKAGWKSSFATSMGNRSVRGSGPKASGPLTNQGNNFNESNRATVCVSCNALIKEIKIKVSARLHPDLDELYQAFESETLGQAAVLKRLDDLVGMDVIQDAALALQRKPPPPTHKPGELPPGWKEYRDKNGRPYYYNIQTKKTTWNKPSAEKPLPPPPPPPKPPPEEAEDEDDEDEDEVGDMDATAKKRQTLARGDTKGYMHGIYSIERERPGAEGEEFGSTKNFVTTSRV